MARCHGFNPTHKKEFWTQCTEKAKHKLAGEEFCDEHYWKTVGTLLAFLDDGCAVVGLVIRKITPRTKHGVTRDGVRGNGIRKFYNHPPHTYSAGILQGDGGPARE